MELYTNNDLKGTIMAFFQCFKFRKRLLFGLSSFSMGFLIILWLIYGNYYNGRGANTYFNINESNLVLKTHINSILNHGIDDAWSMDKRKNRMMRVCRHYRYSGAFDNITDIQKQRILVDIKHETLICYVPKAGSTNFIKMLMMVANGDVINQQDFGYVHTSDNLRNYGYSWLSDYTQLDQIKVWKAYKKIIITRNPFQRLLSGYLDKLKGIDFSLSSSRFSNWWNKIKLRQIINSSRNSSLSMYWKDVNFNEFIQYILKFKYEDKNKAYPPYSQHWISINDLCNPCSMLYDYIVKTDSYAEDIEFLQKQVYRNNTLFHLPPKTNSHVSNSVSTFNEYYENVSKKDFNSLVNIYRMDLEIFDYRFDVLHH